MTTPLDDVTIPAQRGAEPAAAANPLSLLADVPVEVCVELGRVRVPLGELLALGPGALLELDTAADAPVEIRVNGTLVGHGEIVVVDGDFGVRVTSVARRA